MIKYTKSVSIRQCEILASKKTGTPNRASSKSSKGYYLTLFAFVMITFATVMSIRNFPTRESLAGRSSSSISLQS